MLVPSNTLPKAMKKSRLYIIVALFGALAIVWVWLFRMQYVDVVFDTITTERLDARTLPDLAWNDLCLVAGGHILDLSLPDKPATTARIAPAPDGRLILASDGVRVILGRRARSVINNTETIKPAFVYALEPGDRLSWSAEQSWFGWPTFFEVNFMTGSVTRWRRYRYYRLTLEKASGLTAEMVWRYEEFYYGGEPGWTDADKLCEDYEPACGLIRVRIRRRT